MIIATDYHIECNLLRENKEFKKEKKKSLIYFCVYIKWIITFKEKLTFIS